MDKKEKERLYRIMKNMTLKEIKQEIIRLNKVIEAKTKIISEMEKQLGEYGK